MKHINDEGIYSVAKAIGYLLHAHANCLTIAGSEKLHDILDELEMLIEEDGK